MTSNLYSKKFGSVYKREMLELKVLCPRVRTDMETWRCVKRQELKILHRSIDISVPKGC